MNYYNILKMKNLLMEMILMELYYKGLINHIFKEEKEPNSYKFKPLYLNTIDFLLKFNNSSKYFELYLSGNYKRFFLNNMKKLPKEKSIYRLNNSKRPILHHQILKDYEKILIYFYH